MDIRSLNQVLAIRKYGSFGKAAEALGISQPNLSNSVARLEDQLKLKLFDRTAKGSALTPVGELIAERAEAVIAETRDLARDAALLAGGETGVVRIGSTSALQAPFVTPLLQWIVRRHPRLKVHVEVAPAARLLPLLEARDLDLVFTHSRPDLPEPAYVVEVVVEAPAVCVASPSHPLANERNISIARLAEFKCGGALTPGSSTAKLLGLESENFGIYTASHYDLLVPLVLSGDITLLLPSFFAQPYLQSNEMVVLDVDWRYEAKFHLVTTRGASHSPIVKEIREQAHTIGRAIHDEWREMTSRFTPATP